MDKEQLSNELGTVICSRRLRVVKGQKASYAVVRIGIPKRRGRNWACPFHVSRFGPDEPTLAYGVDSAQALIMAFVGIRVLLDSIGEWAWKVGEPGETGFPFIVPMGYGATFSRKIEQMIEAETKKLIGAAKHRAKRRES